MIIQGIRYASDFEAKKLMIETGHDLDEKGYTLAQDGSMSVRVGPNAVWVTTGSSENGSLAQGDFVRVDLNGKSMNHSPDAVLPEDLEVHLKIYRENPQIQGVIHAYPACAVVLQGNGRGLEVCSYTPAIRSLGKITLVPTGDPGQISACAALAAKSDKGVLLENDGCLMWGGSIREAYRNIRLLDYCVKVQSLSCGGAGAAPMPSSPGGMSAAGTLPAAGTVAAGVSSAAGIPGLTGLYRPSGTPGLPRQGGNMMKTAAPQPVSYGMVKQTAAPEGSGTGNPVSFAGNAMPGAVIPSGGNVADNRIIQSAPSDPVRDATMAAVVKKSMKMMGKGGL